MDYVTENPYSFPSESRAVRVAVPKTTLHAPESISGIVSVPADLLPLGFRARNQPFRPNLLEGRFVMLLSFWCDCKRQQGVHRATTNSVPVDFQELISRWVSDDVEPIIFLVGEENGKGLFFRTIPSVPNSGGERLLKVHLQKKWSLLVRV